jgi:FixJ family two-component response regulator
MNEMQITKGCVGVVEDDAAVRKSVCLMLESLGMEVHAYATAHEYLNDSHGRSNCACLILDVRLPGLSGMELQKQLLSQARTPGIVFITGHGDVPMAVEAMRNGAVDFLQKPFKEQQLLDSVHKALKLERRFRDARDKSDVTAARLACLTPREREVLKGIQRGLRTKEVAAELGLATKTAEEHRANLMRKMHASTIAELISMCAATP